jgi:hypothetical protein
VSVDGELPTHGASLGGVEREEAGFVDPHMNRCLCVLDMGSGGGVFLWNENFAPSEATWARRAPCLVVSEGGV